MPCPIPIHHTDRTYESNTSPLSSDPGCNPACRACHYKDLGYDRQLERKQRWAQENLRQWGEAVRAISPAPVTERLAYRSKAWMRSHWNDEGAGDLSFGMYRAARDGEDWKKEFVSWNECPIHAEAIQKIVARIRNAFARELRDFAKNSLLGVWMGSPHLVVVGRSPREQARPRAEELARLDWPGILEGPFDQAWYHRTHQAGSKVFQHREFHLIHGPKDRAPTDGKGAHPILAFRQNAKSLLNEARDRAVSALLAPSPSLVLDLYCGAGEIARLVPANVGWIGIELSVDAVRFANSLEPPSRRTHSAYAGTVEQRLADARALAPILRGESYSLYLNPPRTGLGRDAQGALLALLRARPPLSIAYLSCSASSLARDLEIFAQAGYRPELLQPYDFFPQTEHFETLALLKRLS